jgi:hypothetical protein
MIRSKVLPPFLGFSSPGRGWTLQTEALRASQTSVTRYHLTRYNTWGRWIFINSAVRTPRPALCDSVCLTCVTKSVLDASIPRAFNLRPAKYEKAIFKEYKARSKIINLYILNRTCIRVLLLCNYSPLNFTMDINLVLWNKGSKLWGFVCVCVWIGSSITRRMCTR